MKFKYIAVLAMAVALAGCAKYGFDQPIIIDLPPIVIPGKAQPTPTPAPVATLSVAPTRAIQLEK